MELTENVSLKLDKLTFQILAEVAGDERGTRSRLIREAIRDYLRGMGLWEGPLSGFEKEPGNQRPHFGGGRWKNAPTATA